MKQTRANSQSLIWWGRGNPAYSRNAVVRSAMEALGWSIRDYRPSKAVSMHLLQPRGLSEDAALVWVPCFRHRDLPAAARWAKRRGIPLVFDPLISAYDKQVFERQKFHEASRRARRLLRWERKLVAKPDRVIADTRAHADFFVETLGASPGQMAVVPVSAEPAYFQPQPMSGLDRRRVRVLFYGSFISLQGPEVIVEAAKRCPQADWCLLGDGPLRASCQASASGYGHITFEPWIDYAALPDRIAQADILLGVFSDSAKAGRVVPNKVYQSLACGRPVVTRTPLAGAYPWPASLPESSSGTLFVPPADAEALAQTVGALSASPERIIALGRAAAERFEHDCSMPVVKEALAGVLSGLPR